MRFLPTPSIDGGVSCASFGFEGIEGKKKTLVPNRFLYVSIPIKEESRKEGSPKILFSFFDTGLV